MDNNDSNNGIYEAEGPHASMDELFTGNLPLEQALQKLRTRLLDLSSRNRLLNYRHPKGRSVQFVDAPNLNLAYTRLVDGKSLVIKYVPDPPTDSYARKRPDVRSHAQSLGIDVEAEFPSSAYGSSANKHTPKLQALYYPTDLDKLCRKVSGEARTVIEETGTNMLYLVFGFLEWYEREDSERPMLAPLLAVPVALEKGGIDLETRTYQYSLAYSGEDILENHTLREKLNQEFSFHLPEFPEDAEPGPYLDEIRQSVKNMKRWRVRHQLTLAFLSFNKLAIWEDLDPKKWPGLLKHPLLREVFSGGSGKDSGDVAEDYDIDQHPQGDLPVIYDADPSQHSAIIDVLAGKNMVINGPPGTGKSQTITNVIAAALKSGKRVLFVSEKLAALEVVRHRLSQAGLGHFCLELHSHKTQKKRLLSDIQERMDAKFLSVSQISGKAATAGRLKKDLNRYAELMASRLGNELDLTIHEVFWKAERQRLALGDLASVVQSLFLQDAHRWSGDEIDQRRGKLEALGHLYATVGNFGPGHPWWGFTPRRLYPGDDESIGNIVTEALGHAEALQDLIAEYQQVTASSDEPTLAALGELYRALQILAKPPANLCAELLPRIFTRRDPKGQSSKSLLKEVARKIGRARELDKTADARLAEDCEVDVATVEQASAAARERLSAASFTKPLTSLGEAAATANEDRDRLQQALAETQCRYVVIQKPTLTTLTARLEATAPLELAHQSVRAIREGSGLLGGETARLTQAFQRVAAIAEHRHIEFDGSPASVARLSAPERLEGLLPNSVVDDSVVGTAQRAAASSFASLPLREISRRHEVLKALHERLTSNLAETSEIAQQLGLPFDATSSAVTRLAVLARIAACAPTDLLDHRHPGLAHPRTSELLRSALAALQAEKAQRDALSVECYLDALPSTEEIHAAVRVFRRGDNLFNFLNRDWRAARKLFQGISRTKTKRSAGDCERQLSVIAEWMEYRAAFVGSEEFKAAFGPLFKGLETDVVKIDRLHTWLAASEAEMRQHPGLADTIDWFAIDARRLGQIAAQAAYLDGHDADLKMCLAEVMPLLGPVAGTMRDTLQRAGWTAFCEQLAKLAQGLARIVSFLDQYVTPEVSPTRAVEVLCAKRELVAAKEDFDALESGVEAIRETVEPMLTGIAALSCQRWNGYLTQLMALAQAGHRLAESLAEFGDEEATPRTILNVLEGKLALDASVGAIAPPPDKYPASSWSGYLDAARAPLDVVARLVDVLGPIGADGASADEVLNGLHARREASDIIASLSHDAAVTSLLEGLFAGTATDLDSLEATHSWGTAVATNLTIRSSALGALLLSKEGERHYTWALQSLGAITELRQRIEGRLHELGTFGIFKWDEWHRGEAALGRSDCAGGMVARLQGAAANVAAVLPWARYANERLDCKKEGLVDFIVGLEQRKLPSTALGAVFECIAFRSIGRSIYQRFPELESFAGAKHEQKRLDFAALDNEIVRLTGKGFAHDIHRATVVPEGQTGIKASDRTEMHLLRHELGKQRRHIPIRQLIKRAGRAIQALKPCFMMGPMSVAQYLEQGAVEFDMVVMDEASQLRPEDALGAIARGKQLVVVGDPKQLPPTNFFDRLTDGGDDDEEEEASAVLVGSESILDICQQLFHPVRTLRWHYRSQHESLIAFSNHHFYGGKLVVFPSPFERNRRLGVRYRYIGNGAYKDRQNVPEAQRVVDAVLEHMMTHPEESLGVVTLNQTQRDLIEDLLDKKVRNIEEAQAFISQWEEDGWPFFVKNLENVQGDERDVIFISTTFGRAPGTDKVRQNFGPISRPDGWRRLNVLFTRARHKLELFTSMLPEDIVLDAKSPQGTAALKNYLDFAKRGVLTASDIGEREPDSDFEVAVGEVLRNRDFEVVPQLGVAGYFIDLAVRNPDRPGEFLAAIECDGATYHSSRSARDRDRIRQAILESLGWKDRIWRIWSTDWFYDPRRETERLLRFLEERRTLARREPPPEYEEDEFLGDEPAAQQETSDEATADTEAYAFAGAGEDLFVEVGDRVTYCFADQPEERHSVMIVDTESNPRLNLVNEDTPLARALLNGAVGDEPTLEVPGKPPRRIRVLKIQREESLAD